MEEVSDVNIRVQLGDTSTTPLIHAAKNGQYSVVEHLSAKCVESIDQCDSDGRTVLHYACMHGKLSIVDMLLDKYSGAASLGAAFILVFYSGKRLLNFIDLKDNGHDTASMLAAKKANYDIVCHLICHGADVKCLPYNEGKRALSWVIANYDLEHSWKTVNSLIISGFLGIEQFHAISTCERLSKFKYRFLASAVAASLRKIFTFAITKKLYTVELISLIPNSIVNGLLDINPPITALMWAVQNGDVELLKLLIPQGLSLNIHRHDPTGRTALHYAAENDHIQCGILLLDAGASADEILEPRTTSKISISCSQKFREAMKQASLFQSKKTVCVIGNACSGKSTLIASLQNENASYWTHWYHWIWGVKEISERTTGIEPVPLSSKRYGDVVFLDFAGQHEYHGPHEMFLESILTQSRSTVTVIVVVKATDEESLKLEQFERWLYPLSLVPNTTSPVRVIPVASFMDSIPRTSRASLKERMECCYQTAQNSFASSLNVQFLKICYLNCRRPYATDIKKLCTYLNDIPIPSFKAVDTPYSICWVISLINISIEEKAIQMSSFSKWIADSKHNLPANLPSTEQL